MHVGDVWHRYARGVKQIHQRLVTHLGHVIFVCTRVKMYPNFLRGWFRPPWFGTNWRRSASHLIQISNPLFHCATNTFRWSDLNLLMRLLFPTLGMPTTSKVLSGRSARCHLQKVVGGIQIEHKIYKYLLVKTCPLLLQVLTPLEWWRQSVGNRRTCSLWTKPSICAGSASSTPSWLPLDLIQGSGQPYWGSGCEVSLLQQHLGMWGSFH